MVYWPPYLWYIDPLPIVYLHPTHGISIPYPWYFDPPTHGTLTPFPMVYRPPYPWYIDPHIHGIFTLLPMVYRPPNPWYFDPPAHGISTPLPMVYQTLSYGRNEGEINLPWVGSKYDKKLTLGSKYHMENWTRGQNIICKLTPGSIYNGVQNTIWHR